MRKRWTAEEDAIVRAQYPNVKTETLAAQLNRPLCSVYNRAFTLGLKKSAAYLASADACRLRKGDNVGAAHRFKTGQTPVNKGVKHPKGWAPGRMRQTQFTPGQAGWNWKPVGAERIISGYRYTKIADERRVSWTKNWKATHILNWEAANGALPEGHCLKTIDGNPLNVDPSNWQMVARGMLPRLNGGRHKRLSYDHAPDELKPTLMALAKLAHVAKSRTKKVAA